MVTRATTRTRPSLHLVRCKNSIQESQKEDRTLLRREFQGWFSKSWDDIDVLWLPYFKEWGNDSCDENCSSWLINLTSMVGSSGCWPKPSWMTIKSVYWSKDPTLCLTHGRLVLCGVSTTSLTKSLTNNGTNSFLCQGSIQPQSTYWICPSKLDYVDLRFTCW